MIPGRCHCGNISFSLAWEPEPAQIPARACGCSFCLAEFHICARCGVVPVVTSTLDGRVYAVVSVNAFEGIDPARIRRAPADFEGEATEARLARRKRNWIPDVVFE